MSAFYGEGSTRELKQDWGLLLLPHVVLSSSGKVTVMFLWCIVAVSIQNTFIAKQLLSVGTLNGTIHAFSDYPRNRDNLTENSVAAHWSSCAEVLHEVKF